MVIEGNTINAPKDTCPETEKKNVATYLDVRQGGVGKRLRYNKKGVIIPRIPRSIIIKSASESCKCLEKSEWRGKNKRVLLKEGRECYKSLRGIDAHSELQHIWGEVALKKGVGKKSLNRKEEATRLDHSCGYRLGRGGEPPWWGGGNIKNHHERRGGGGHSFLQVEGSLTNVGGTDFSKRKLETV